MLVTVTSAGAPLRVGGVVLVLLASLSGCRASKLPLELADSSKAPLNIGLTSVAIQGTVTGQDIASDLADDTPTPTAAPTNRPQLLRRTALAYFAIERDAQPVAVVCQSSTVVINKQELSSTIVNLLDRIALLKLFPDLDHTESASVVQNQMVIASYNLAAVLGALDSTRGSVPVPPSRTPALVGTPGTDIVIQRQVCVELSRSFSLAHRAMLQVLRDNDIAAWEVGIAAVPDVPPN